MDWFERLTGFRELGYDATRERLRIDGGDLVSTVNDQRYGIGALEVPTLDELRKRTTIPTDGHTTVRCITGEVRAMHADPEFTGALFQVASQFNLLEMTGPNVTPEDGVTRYADDHTQGPACAVAAGAATIYRNYVAEVDGQAGQTSTRQLDGLRHVGAALAQRLDTSVDELWTMRNGYALCSPKGLRAVADLDPAERERLRGLLAIGLHRDVEVTDVREHKRRIVSQAFCSALPVAYGEGPQQHWEAFARLVLEATYEATLLAAVEHDRTVLLTRVGGGVFGNADAWIDDAIVRALRIVEHAGLDVRLVSHREIHPSFRAIAQDFSDPAAHRRS